MTTPLADGHSFTLNWGLPGRRQHTYSLAGRLEVVNHAYTDEGFARGTNAPRECEERSQR